MKLLLIAMCLTLLPGCMGYERWQTAQAKREILQDYKSCLRAGAGNFEKQKQCAAYQQALIQLDVTQHR